MTDLEKFRQFTAAGAHYPEHGSGSDRELTYLALGLAGETGEAVDIIKKMIRDSSPTLTLEQREKFILELGDVLWYWTRLVWVIGADPEEVIQKNMDKLIARYPEQFKDFKKH
jgi:NTP pyrophosphatase (non-canonical NTP hydrolase)